MILVTGATGFIGRRLTRRLLKEGYEVAVVCRKTSDFSRLEDVKERLIKVDSAQEEELEAVFRAHDITHIIHLATAYGRDSRDFQIVYETNLTLPLKLIRYAMAESETGVKTVFINTDSFFTKELEGAWHQGGEKVYLDAYTKSKFILREIMRDNVSSTKITFVNLRLEHVYGPEDDKGKFINYLISELRKNTPVIELSSGVQVRDWVYIDDVIEAYIKVLEHSENLEPAGFYEYEVGTGKETTLKNFCLKLKEESKSSSELVFGRREMQKNELLYSVADNSALRAIGWEPSVDIEEGIRRIFRG